MFPSVCETDHGNINSYELSNAQIYEVETKSIKKMVELRVWDRAQEELLEGSSQLPENNLELILVTDIFISIQYTLAHTVINGMMAPLAIAHVALITRMKMSILVAYLYNIVYDISIGGIDS